MLGDDAAARLPARAARSRDPVSATASRAALQVALADRADAEPHRGRGAVRRRRAGPGAIRCRTTSTLDDLPPVDERARVRPRRSSRPSSASRPRLTIRSGTAICWCSGGAGAGLTTAARRPLAVSAARGGMPRAVSSRRTGGCVGAAARERPRPTRRATAARDRRPRRAARRDSTPTTGTSSSSVLTALLRDAARPAPGDRRRRAPADRSARRARRPVRLAAAAAPDLARRARARRGATRADSTPTCRPARATWRGAVVQVARAGEPCGDCPPPRGAARRCAVTLGGRIRCSRSSPARPRAHARALCGASGARVVAARARRRARARLRCTSRPAPVSDGPARRSGRLAGRLGAAHDGTAGVADRPHRLHARRPSRAAARPRPAAAARLAAPANAGSPATVARSARCSSRLGDASTRESEENRLENR